MGISSWISSFFREVDIGAEVEEAKPAVKPAAVEPAAVEPEPIVVTVYDEYYVLISNLPDHKDWGYWLTVILKSKDRKLEREGWTIRNTLVKKMLSKFPEYEFDIQIDGEEKEMILSGINPVQKKLSVPVAFGEIIYADLYDHQKSGVEFLAGVKRAILGDDMGLGKTLQAITTVGHFGGKTLVVAPKSLLLNWKREIEKFGVMCRAHIMGSENPVPVIGYNFYLVNYNVLARHNDFLKDYNFTTMIVDESHYIKNPNSIRSRVVMDLAGTIENLLLLTGTILKNKTEDLYTSLYLTNKELVSPFLPKENKKVKKHHRKWGRSFKYEKQLKELRDKMQSVYLRRTKEEVLDLPEKIRTDIHVEGAGKAVSKYKRLLAEFRKKDKTAQEKKVMIGLVNLMKKQAALSKVEATLELAISIIEQGHKIIIFSDFADVIDAVLKGLAKAKIGFVKIDGRDTSIEKRDASVVAFQNDESIRAFVGGIRSAGVGLTLTAGTYEIFNDWSYAPTDQDQAEDRAYRIGQEEIVNVYNVIADNIEFDARINEILNRKRQLISMVQDGQRYVDDDGQKLMDEILEDISAS